MSASLQVRAFADAPQAIVAALEPPQKPKEKKKCVLL
jgi:hypothetical protein